MSTLERDEVVNKLQAWQQHRIDGEGIWQWALQAAAERSSEDEVVKAVMEMLCALPQDLWIEEDAEVMVDALNNPLDQTDLSVNLLWNYPDIIDLRSRRRALEDHPLYGPYCVD
ncbi:MAG: hypothetical protein GWP70_06245 [Proteobacteria bacterium]|nr:hypothetical protein [Pseudomonadota bacterium]